MVYGDRIYLRAIEQSDIEPCYRWMNDREVTQYILAGKWPLSRLAEQAWVDRAARGENPNDRALAICLRDGGRHIGNTGLHRIDWHSRTAVLGILIGEKDCWGQGYGTDAVRTLVRYAFEDLNLRKVSLSVLAHNGRAVRCYEKCGFVREGCRRAQYYKDGRYVDDIEMAVFAPGCEPTAASG
jgi:RimJ/RimL family protein N-acetyltransferase